MTAMHDSQAWKPDQPITDAAEPDALRTGGASERRADWAALGRLVLAEARRRASRARCAAGAGGLALDTDLPAGGAS